MCKKISLEFLKNKLKEESKKKTKDFKESGETDWILFGRCQMLKELIKEIKNMGEIMCNNCADYEMHNQEVKKYNKKYMDKMLGIIYKHCPDCGRRLV